MGEIWLRAITAACAFLLAFGVLGIILRAGFDRDSGKMPHDNDDSDLLMVVIGFLGMCIALATLLGFHLVELWSIQHP